MSLIDEQALRALVADEVRRILATEGRAQGGPLVPAQPSAQLWTVDEATAYLRMSRSWVFDQAAAGLLPCRKLGRAIRFDPEEVRGFARGEAPPSVGGRVLPMPRRGG